MLPGFNHDTSSAHACSGDDPNHKPPVFLTQNVLDPVTYEEASDRVKEKLGLQASTIGVIHGICGPDGAVGEWMAAAPRGRTASYAD